MHLLLQPVVGQIVDLLVGGLNVHQTAELFLVLCMKFQRFLEAACLQQFVGDIFRGFTAVGAAHDEVDHLFLTGCQLHIPLECADHGFAGCQIVGKPPLFQCLRQTDIAVDTDEAVLGGFKCADFIIRSAEAMEPVVRTLLGGVLRKDHAAVCIIVSTDPAFKFATSLIALQVELHERIYGDAALLAVLIADANLPHFRRLVMADRAPQGDLNLILCAGNGAVA